ncbi:MAG: RNA polymerase sigma factor, partial [Candidatus Binataceae bacterium]
MLAISGDVTAFEALVRRYQTYVGALVRRACGDADLADDLTQMTFLKAWQRMRSLREVESFRPWLRRIAL